MSCTLGLFAILAAFSSAPETVTLRGQVVLLTEVMDRYGLSVDRGPIAEQVALETHDEVIVPLLLDEGSRAFFVDPRLRRREVELRGRRFPGLPYFQVTSVNVRDGEEWRTPEYWCDVCAIRVRYPQDCPCCQGPMLFRLRPSAR